MTALTQADFVQLREALRWLAHIGHASDHDNAILAKLDHAIEQVQS